MAAKSGPGGRSLFCRSALAFTTLPVCHDPHASGASRPLRAADQGIMSHPSHLSHEFSIPPLTLFSFFFLHEEREYMGQMGHWDGHLLNLVRLGAQTPQTGSAHCPTGTQRRAGCQPEMR